MSHAEACFIISMFFKKKYYFVGFTKVTFDLLNNKARTGDFKLPDIL